MATKKEEEQAMLERDATFLLRENGFDAGGLPAPGKINKQRRRDACIRHGLPLKHFEPTPE